MDVSIDGCDEVDGHLNALKGRGGPFLQEKMVESASKRFIIGVDSTKV